LFDLSVTYSRSTKTIRRYFDNHEPVVGEIIASKEAVNLMIDATFFNRRNGLLIARANGKNLLWKEIETESTSEYEIILSNMVFAGFSFKSFTIDGRRGVIHLLQRTFPNIPIQMCNFHQAAIVRRYNTNNPKTLCGIELKALAGSLTKTNRKEFTQRFTLLKDKYVDFLKERNERNQFTHKRLRSAIRSIQTNLPYLFTYQDYPEFNIPNTTNSCDGSFSHWKNKVKIHRGLANHRKTKMINYLLENS
jgi:hypothetical protein